MSSHVLLKTLFSTSKNDIFSTPCKKIGDIIFKNALKKPENKAFSGFFIRTGDERIELPPKVLETPIIPVDQSPTFRIFNDPSKLHTWQKQDVNQIIVQALDLLVHLS